MMTPQFLIVKIQALLGGRAEVSDMQKRSIAVEYYRLCTDAEAQLEHCVALIRAGRDYPALQVAESSSLLDSLNALMFEQLPRWRDFCTAEKLPVPPPFDDSQIELVNSLYTKGVSQNHPLYRDYRRAMRLRKYGDALAVIKTISKINAYDSEARRECDRLRKRVSDARLSMIERALKTSDTAEILRLCELLEPDSDLIAENKIWKEAFEFKRARASEGERERCMTIIRELEKLDIGKDFERASELVTEFNLIRSDADFVAEDLAFIENISKQTAVKQDEILAAERSARARNLIYLELEQPDPKEKKRAKISRLKSLKTDAADTLDSDTLRKLDERISKLLMSVRLAFLAKFSAGAAILAAASVAAYSGYGILKSENRLRSADDELAQIEMSTEPSSISALIANFQKKYPALSAEKYSARIAKLSENASVAEMRSASAKRIAESVERVDFSSAASAVFDSAQSDIEKLYADLPSLSPVERARYKDRADALSKKISDAVDARRAKLAALIRENLSKYEAVASDYESFSRPKGDIDADAANILAYLRPAMEDVSRLFKPHQIDSDRFNEISARISDAKERYAKFDKMREAMLTSRTGAEYMAAMRMLAESGSAPADFSKKLLRISEQREAIKLGQSADFGSASAVASVDSAGTAARASLPENALLTNVYKYSREGKIFVYTLGKISERTQKWKGGSEIIQDVSEISAGGSISTTPYRKHFIDGREPRGELLVGECVAPESLLGREVLDEASKKSLLSALTVAANGSANSVFKIYLEGLIFSKLKENPVETLLEYSPAAKARMQSVERYSKAYFDYSWIFESDSRAKFLNNELYSKPAPDYYKEAVARVEAIKICRENPIMLIGVCNESGKETLFKDAKGAIWSVDAATGKFGRIGADIAACKGKFAPLAPIFSEVKSDAEINAEASLK